MAEMKVKPKAGLASIRNGPMFVWTRFPDSRLDFSPTELDQIRVWESYQRLRVFAIRKPTADWSPCQAALQVYGQASIGPRDPSSANSELQATEQVGSADCDSDVNENYQLVCRLVVSRSLSLFPSEKQKAQRVLLRFLLGLSLESV